jgi:hypothetical protein
MGVTPAPSESSVQPLPVRATATSCGVEFPVEGVAVVCVCPLEFLWKIGFTVSVVGHWIR